MNPYPNLPFAQSQPSLIVSSFEETLMISFRPYMERYIAAASAVRTDRVHFFEILPSLVSPHLSGERACRAYRHTLAAELTVEVFFKGRTDLCFHSSVAKSIAPTPWISSHILTHWPHRIHFSISLSTKGLLSFFVYTLLSPSNGFP